MKLPGDNPADAPDMPGETQVFTSCSQLVGVGFLKPEKECQAVAQEYTAADGQRFRSWCWRADREVARVFAIHGMGSAATEFHPLGTCLRSAGISLFACDLRGNGNDPQIRRRGAEFDVPKLTADFQAWLAATQSGRPAKYSPAFLCGESLGGLLAARLLASGGIASQFRGVIFLSPVVELNHPVPPIVKGALRLLAALAPGLKIGPNRFVHGGKPPPPLTRNPAYDRYVKTAPHRISRYSVRFTWQAGELLNWVAGHAETIHTPALFLVGENDGFVCPDKARAWFERLAAGDKTFVLFKEGRHVLLHDLDAPGVCATIRDWISERLGPANP